MPLRWHIPLPSAGKSQFSQIWKGFGAEKLKRKTLEKKRTVKRTVQNNFTGPKPFYSSHYAPLGVVLDGEILATDHSVPLEPLATDLLGGTVGGVGPLDGDTVVVRILLAVRERVAAVGHLCGLLRIEPGNKNINPNKMRGPAIDQAVKKVSF